MAESSNHPSKRGDAQTTGRARAAVILAAGKSTRMKSTKSKVLHELAGRPLLGWVHALATGQGVERCICVVGEANADVRAYAESLGMEIAVQEPQLGTGHAVLCAEDALGDFAGDVIVLYADTPMIAADTVARTFDSLSNHDVAVLGFEAALPNAYGRLVEAGGELQRIVEVKEANEAELEITLCNSGVMAGDRKRLFDALAEVGNDNAKGEYYLTDVVEIVRRQGGRATAVRGDEAEMLGVNSRADLATAHTAFQDNMRRLMLSEGVTLRDPSSVYFSYDTEIAPDATIGENVVFGPGVSIGAHTTIHPFCHIEGTRIGSHAQIGPFARLRPGTKLSDSTKVGNFVETKKSIVGPGSKINHLSYIGDAELGEGVNVGAGTITCNYDGFSKHKTIIGDGAFIGTNSSLVAPVTIGAGAYLGSGGTITKDVPEDALAVARAHQSNKEGWAKRFRETMKKRLDR